ncbi:MAG: phosphate acyltransferase PlsX [Legionellaceae bacterium]|nr:phosphate acyltransferase PlsX [Legionellaceae bacterium]
MDTITIAIDAMGGDHGLSVIIPACVNAVNKNTKLRLLLVGDQSSMREALARHTVRNSQQLELVHASEVVAMDELPSHAIRNKKDSSMRVALNLLKEGRARACVSAGNTGALMAISRFVLKTLNGIDRPAIISQVPTLSGKTRVMDLGANVDSCAEHLFQFAVMGTALLQAIDHIPNPRIGLLNIGVEEIKGNDQVKRTAHMLAECSLLNYVGYVEGDQFYSGDIDLIVCDGFVGNVALKTSEGLAKLMQGYLRHSFTRTLYSRLVGLVAAPVINDFKKQLDPSLYNGASMLGLNGIVVKSHGGASALGFECAIEQATLQIKNYAIDLVRDKINDFINHGLLL